ncbi:unnamed protein product [Allacma fusca]|uniref:Uncharacterized protein n=1 Tax=Allacma fusca TaxID=39272 RepID=A0A8J2LKM5_9HEXA|nr:unnamed protein product [Allacma fusca]
MKRNTASFLLTILSNVSTLQAFEVKDVLHPIKNCVISLYEYETDSIQEKTFFETLVVQSFSLGIPLVQNTDASVETFYGNGKHPCEILIINGILPSGDKSRYKYREIHMTDRYFNVQREFILFIAVSSKPLREVSNIFHKYLYRYHENIIAMQVSPEENYQIGTLFRFQWYCNNYQLSCVVKLHLQSFLDSMKACHVDHICFIRKFSQSFEYGKDFNAWYVLTNNEYMINEKTNWEFTKEITLRQIWELKSEEYFEILLKSISDIASSRNFTPAIKNQVSNVNHRSTVLPTIYPYANPDEENEFSLYSTVPTDGLSFLQCFFRMTQKFNVLQIFQCLDIYSWAMVLVLIGVLSIFQKRGLSHVGRCLTLVSVLINQVPALKQSEKLLLLWVFAALVINNIYLSNYESILIQPEENYLRSFEELANQNYKIIIKNETSFEHWVVHNKVGPFNFSRILRKLRDSAVTINLAMPKVLESMMQDPASVFCSQPNALTAAIRTFPSVNASKGCKCKMATENLHAFHTFWEFRGPLRRVLYENFASLISSGIHGLYFSYNEIGGRDIFVTSYLQQFGMNKLNEERENHEEFFVFSLKSPEAQSILMIFVCLLVLCSGCFINEYGRVGEKVFGAAHCIYSYSIEPPRHFISKPHLTHYIEIWKNKTVFKNKNTVQKINSK